MTWSDGVAGVWGECVVDRCCCGFRRALGPDTLLLGNLLSGCPGDGNDDVGVRIIGDEALGFITAGEGMRTLKFGFGRAVWARTPFLIVARRVRLERRGPL